MKWIITLFFISVVSILLSSQILLGQSLRLDESQSLWVAVQSPESLLTWVSEDVHVPLYHLILHLWLGIFGFNIESARALSILFFAGTIPVVYFLTKKISSEKIAFTAAALFSLSPFLIWYAHEIRMYTQFLFFSTLQLYFFITFLQSNAKKGKLSFFMTSVLGFYTHYFFFFLVMTEVVYIWVSQLYSFIKQNQGKIKIKQLIVAHKLSILSSLILLGAALTLSPWLYFVYQQGSAANTKPLISAPNTYTLFQTVTQLMFGFQQDNIVNVVISIWPLALIMLFFVFTHRERAPLSYSGLFILLVTLPIAVAYAVSNIRPLFLTRYFTLVAPALFILVAWYINSYKPRVAVVSFAAIAALLIISLGSQNTNAKTPVKENYERAAQYLQDKTDLTDIIAVTAPFTIYPIEYYYKGNTTLITIPAWERYQGKSIETYSLDSFKATLESLKDRYDTIYMIFSYDQGYEKEMKDHMDNHYERLDLQQVSEGIEIRVYKIRYD